MRPASDVVETVKIPPDGGLVESLGTNHSLESALADLIDNSIDAGATDVAIQLVTRDGRLDRVEVADNGRGMDAHDIKDAMTLGHRRDYRPSDLGHFGMGLKAASFGHADVLTVWSQKYGASPVGSRIRKADFSRDFSCEVLTSESASRADARRRALVLGGTGTLVVWDLVRTRYHGRDLGEARSWLDSEQSRVKTHLGVVFHRILARSSVSVTIAAGDSSDEPIPIPITPIDPFGYTTSGDPSYPKELSATVEDQSVTVTCHIWPAKADVTGFRMGSRTGETFQGFFVYRRDRLLQVGGWAEVANPSTARQLARAVLDDDKAIGRFVTMNSEKLGLKFEPVFLEAMARAHAKDGTTFSDYLVAAEEVYTTSRKRRRDRKPAIRPDKGFAPQLRRVIRDELPMIEGEAVKIQWRRLPDDEFLDIDFPARTVWLNSGYRTLFAPERGSLNDAPVVKALIYLLTHHVFEGQRLGARDKDEIALWQSVLSAAAQQARQRRGEA